MRWKKYLSLLLLTVATLVLLTGLKMSNFAFTSPKTEILWDTWGVPHVYAETTESMFNALGYAQMHSHGNLILRLYGQGRGKAAEYWGEDYLPSDRYTRLMGIPQRAEDWYQSQSPTMRRNLDEFAAGINRYAKDFPDQLKPELKTVLPVTGVDVLAHLQRAIHFHFVTNPREVKNWSEQGSNAWAIAPSYSDSGNALLLANPHLPWQDLFLFYEAHLNTPNMNAYGATLVGMPLLAIAFNENLGWTTTVNPLLGTTRYQLTLQEEGYLFDGEVRRFDTHRETIKVKQKDGTYREETLTIRHSVQGVVIQQEEDQAIALRVVGLDQPSLLDQFLQMAQATNLEEFERALSRLQLPLFNILYADQSGNIAYIDNGQIPMRKAGNWEDWSQLMPGNTSETLWTQYHPYSDLPRLVNPDTGWLQNTNDFPWSCTFPPVLDPANFPNYFAPPIESIELDVFRTQRSLKMLLEQPKMSFEQMVSSKFSSYLEISDRILDDLINAAKASNKSILQEAATLLQEWDRQANPNSKGTALFFLWYQQMQGQNIFATPWNPADPLNTPIGLKDPQQAVSILKKSALQLKNTYGMIAVEWEKVAKLSYEDRESPATGASGSLGSFQVIHYAPTPKTNFPESPLQSVGGDSYIAAVEFSQPLHAEVLNVYGNATQPQSKHVGDQLELYSQGQLRRAWFTREEVEVNVVEKMVW